VGGESPIHNLQQLGAGDVRRRLQAGADTLLIPLGSCERHGNPFTPLGIDALAGLAVVEHAARQADVLHTPPLPFGYAPEHMGRPGEGWGTVSLRAETYRRLLEDVGRSLIYQGFSKLVFVSLHGADAGVAEEVLSSLRFHTGALAVYYGGRETKTALEILGSTPDRLSSDIEAAVALALLGERFNAREYLTHSYKVHSPPWLGPEFSKRAGTGMSVAFQGERNISLGMDDFEFVTPVAHNDPLPSAATADKGRQLLSTIGAHLAAFVTALRKVPVEVRQRDYPERVR
jgi:creatinine amidohydrolase